MPREPMTNPSRPIRIYRPLRPRRRRRHSRAHRRQRVGETIGQTIVIENRGGADRSSARRWWQSGADGYTLLLDNRGRISINPAVYKDLRYDPSGISRRSR